MTAQEHLDTAERLLAQVTDHDTAIQRGEGLFLAVWAIGHALAALAIETGVPHAAVAGGAGSGG